MKGKAAPYVLIASVVLAFVWFSVSRTERPLEEITATVEGVTFGPAADHASQERTALIRMANGSVIEARIATPEKVQSGQRARVLVYERALGGRDYEIIEAH
jgi:predicted membrane protein